MFWIFRLVFKLLLFVIVINLAFAWLSGTDFQPVSLEGLPYKVVTIIERAWEVVATKIKTSPSVRERQSRPTVVYKSGELLDSV